ncbi:response regulator [Alteromonas macleodii]|uniref:response regulator n=1 Tax=Alteromonas macleodii TaxID=28108 RepID=UPI0031408A80
MKKILVIEDDGLVRTVIKKQLETAKFKVETAENASKGIQLSQSGDFDLIMLDLNLPDAYGLEISNHLHQPFVVMTATVNDEIREIASEMGAMAFISKPFKIFEILDVLQTAIEKGAIKYKERKKTVASITTNNLESESLTQKNEYIMISIGCLLADFKVSQREAFNRIKNTAEKQGISVEMVASRIVKEYENKISS